MSSINSDSTEFTYLFDVQSTDGWHIDSSDKFVLDKDDRSLRSEGGMVTRTLSNCNKCPVCSRKAFEFARLVVIPIQSLILTNSFIHDLFF